MSSPSSAISKNDDNQQQVSTSATATNNGVFLTAERANEFAPIKLIKKINVSPDTREFRFALDHPNQVLGLPIGQHMSFRATINGEVVTRSYTPISSNSDLGYVEFVIKIYAAGVDPKFPNGGKMSQHLEQLKIGDTIDVKGPTGKFDYKGKGLFNLKIGVSKEFKTQTVKKMALIAGGTGITPMLQIIRAVLKDPEDKTELFLLFGNKTTKDILLKDELDEIAKTHGDRFHVWYTVTRPDSEGPDFATTWKFSTGHVNEDMVKKYLPSAEGNSDVIAFMCGPFGMLSQACKPNLIKHGYQPDQIVAF